MARLQALGDYVPPGAVLATVSASLLPFFLANVILAPLVEETLYRGQLLAGFSRRFGQAWGMVLSCLAFGLLHWTGGVWYMLLTGILAGGLFATLARSRGGLWSAYAAHLALNLVEFIDTAL